MSTPKESTDAKRQPSQPAHDFLTCVKKSGVVGDSELNKWLDGRDTSNEKLLATQMTDDNLLTPWQAKYLLSGRYRLHLGNYTLLERISRDHFGDRFIANHQQLGRKVIVQVLPVELTNHDQHREAFLKQASLAGELNHPNLVHVNDIDRQQGRYFLVTEFFDGQPINSIPAASFSGVQVARLTRDGIAALQYAHDRQVIHGNVNRECIQLSDEGVLKIGQIGLAPLVKDHDPAKTSKINDLLSFGSVMQGWSEQCPSLAAENDAASELRSLFSRLALANDANEFALTSDRLNEWISENENANAPAIDVMDEPAGQEDATMLSGLPTGQTPAPAPAAASPVPRPSARPAKKKPGKTPSTRSRLPWISIAAVTVALLGELGFLASQFLSSGSSDSAGETAQRSATSDKDSTNSSANDDSWQLPKMQNLEGTPAEDASDDAEGQSIDSKAEPANESDDGSSNDENMFDPVLNDTPPTDDANLEVSSDDTNSGTNGNDSPPAAVDGTGEASESASDSTGDEEVKTDASDQAASADPPQPVGEPLSNLPDTVELPEHPSTDSVVLTQVVVPNNQLLGLSLLSPPAISKTRLLFDLDRLPDDKQRWNVLLKRNSNDEGDIIAQFSRSAAGLEFVWTQPGVDSKLSNYLRNCMLKLTTLDKTAWLKLRQPLKLENFKITEKEPQVVIDSAVPWLPDPEGVVVELLPWDKGMPDVWIEPTTILQTGQPAAIHFYEAVSNRIFWLGVESDLRGKLKLELQPWLLIPGGGMEPVKKFKMMEEYAASMKQLATEAQSLYDRNKDLEAPYGQKTKFNDYKKQLKSTAATATKQSENAEANVQIMNNLVDRPIPLQIYFKLDEHRIVLANTVGGSSAESTTSSEE